MKGLLSGRFISTVTLVCAVFLSLALSRALVFPVAASLNQEKSNQDQGVPAYHDGPPAGELSPVMDPNSSKIRLCKPLIA